MASSPNPPEDRGGLDLPPFYPILDIDVARDRQLDPLRVLDAWLTAGVRLVQLRAKSLAGGAFLGLADACLRRTREAGALLIVNDRVDVAALAGADGVHLGQEDMAVADVRRLSGARLLVGVSTANVLHATRALREGADYCGIGPMFPSSTKPKDVAGVEYLRKYLEYEPKLPPHLAIGGIGPSNIEALVAAGARGVAVSSAVCESMYPGDVVSRLRAALDRGAAGKPGDPGAGGLEPKS